MKPFYLLMLFGCVMTEWTFGACSDPNLVNDSRGSCCLPNKLNTKANLCCPDNADFNSRTAVCCPKEYPKAVLGTCCTSENSDAKCVDAKGKVCPTGNMNRAKNSCCDAPYNPVAHVCCTKEFPLAADLINGVCCSDTTGQFCITPRGAR